jgi:hypothetical protein
MGLPRKGSRALEVDGHRYRWIPIYSHAVRGCGACPLRLTVQRENGHGQRLVARFAGQALVEGTMLVFPRYGSELTPGVVVDIIRAGFAAGWEPEATRRPPLEIDGEPFLRLPPDPTVPPPGSFLYTLRAQLVAASLAPPELCSGCGATRVVTASECSSCGKRT